MGTAWPRLMLALGLVLLSIFPASLAAIDNQVWKYTDDDGTVVYLPDNRRPALYTGNYGDCLGSSLIKLDRFDASFYRDNMTVTFRLGGSTNLTSEGLMMYIGVFAYGQSRFDLTFNPCNANIDSLCPARSNVSIEANGYIPLAQSDISDVPNIAYSIPDFEGQVILRIFANSTQSEIGCYSGIVTNGSTFSQPASVGSVLGIFTFVAMVASFATAVYGDDIITMRKHHAHSLSVGVVFAVWHHIFYTGALSMNWPSVLVAWWSNFAWAAGMINTNSMQNSIARLVGSNRGNTVRLGAAATGTDASSDVGGGYDIHKIYKRLDMSDIVRDMHSPALEDVLAKRDLANSSTGYKWYGQPVRAGLPLPGNFSGFAGTLAEENIPASNAFMTGLLWFLILIVIIAASIFGLKLALDTLINRGTVKSARFNYFRSHWRGYTVVALLRTCFIAFFVMMFLTIFQFTYDSAPGPLAIAALVFVVFVVGILGVAGYALWYGRHRGFDTSRPKMKIGKENNISKLAPWLSLESRSSPKRAADPEERPEQVPTGGHPSHHGSTSKSVHQDEEYIKKFGWLASRFRRTKWWFFGAWLLYELVRAIFYAGASGHAMVQVFALLVIEFAAFVAIIKTRPFEGQRLNVIMVYLLGFSKVVTVALSAAFNVSFNLARITTTAIGIVIIVIQGLLTIALMIAIILSAISSYMSITRNREDFRPRRWVPLRKRYFAHLDEAVTDLPPPPAPVEPEAPKGPYFSVNSVRRVAKIEDEDPDFQSDIAADPRASQMSLSGLHGNYEPRSRGSRAVSISSQMSYTSLPFGARVHRGSWSTREFMEHQDIINAGAPLGNSLPEAYASRQSMHMYTSTESFQSQRVYPILVQSPNGVAGSGSNTVSGSPTASRAASGLDLRGAVVPQSVRPNSPPGFGAALARPETPQNTRTSSPLHNADNRSPSNDAARMSPVGRRRSFARHRPRDSIDEEVLGIE